MECDLQDFGEWDDWWERAFDPNALATQDPGTADQQRVFPNIPQGQESGQWAPDQDIRR